MTAAKTTRKQLTGVIQAVENLAASDFTRSQQLGGVRLYTQSIICSFVPNKSFSHHYHFRKSQRASSNEQQGVENV